MDYLSVLKVFRKYYGINQKYYSDIHPILYYNDEFYTNPFLKNEEEKEEIKTNCLEKFFGNTYKLGINRDNFFKLFLSILRKNDYVLNTEDIVNKMIYDFDKLNLAREYKLREFYKISQATMRNIIIDEKFDSWEFMQFCSDYFSFKIVFINQDEELREFNPRNDKTILAPKFFVYQDLNNRFLQVILDDKDWIPHNNTLYQDKEESNEVSETELEPEYDCTKLMKMKLIELQDIATQLNINIQKMNPRKTRMINKKKEELISDIIG